MSRSLTDHDIFAMSHDAADATRMFDASGDVVTGFPWDGLAGTRGGDRSMYFESGGGEEYGDDRFPAWIAGTILVAYCAIFWVGLVTVAEWFIGDLF